MRNGGLLLAGTVTAMLLFGLPAEAWWFANDGESWPVFSFHEYDGSDVNRPGGTPDRPYWHGDDAVPLGLRWQDIDAARAAEAAGGVAVVAAVESTPVVPRRRTRRTRIAVRRKLRICVPAPVATR